MKCFWCLVAYQGHATDRIKPAEYVYQGMSCCAEHANSARGLRPDFKRYSKEVTTP